jgi:hypothetical protein
VRAGDGTPAINNLPASAAPSTNWLINFVPKTGLLR